MSIDLIVSPPASGKTEFCIQRIKEAKSTNPLANIWVLVPDRMKGAYFRQRLAESGGSVGVTVGTFRDLYIDILERNSIFIPVVTAALEHRLVKETVNTAFEDHELDHYAAIKDKPGFIQALQDSYAELRGSLVKPDRFLEYTRAATPPRYELARLYDRFISRLNGLNWIDQEGQSWLAISTLEGNPKAAAGIQMVVVDGFTSFTGARRQFLKLLSQQVGEMLITLPGEIESTRQVHRRSRVMIDTLVQDLVPKVNVLEQPPNLPRVSAYFERHIFDPGHFPVLDVSEPFLVEVRSQAEEAREALRWIKALNVRDGVSVNSCAIYVGDLQTYQPLLRAAASEFGVNLYFSHSGQLAESPPIISLLTLLSLPVVDYLTRTVFNTLHSPYFNFGLDAKAVEDLEKISQQAIIVKGRDQWEDAWGRLTRAHTESASDLDEERRRNNLIAGIDLHFLRKAFDQFWDLFASVDETRSLGEWVPWLETLLESLNFYENINNDRDWEACKSLNHALRALVMSEIVTGIRHLSYDQFLADIQSALNGAGLEEAKDTRRNAVFVGRMVEARGSRFKAVALLGLSEGLFPVVENPDPFLDEQLRRDLGLEPRLQREQVSIFYQAITRSDRHLLITRPYLSEDGEPWEPSPYWLSIKGLFSDNAVKKFTPGKARPQFDAASPQELLFWGVQQNYLFYEQDEELVSRWKNLEQARVILDARRSKQPRGPYEGNVELVSKSITGEYSPNHTWSASRLEEYATCPFKYYISSTLNLKVKETPEPGLDAAQMGNVYHSILELVFTRSSDQEETATPLEILDEVAASVFQTAPYKYGFRVSPLWEVEKAQYIEKLYQTIQGLEEISAGWVPYRFEQDFGKHDNPELIISLGSESVQIKGIIDRVDINKDGQIRIMDYKTGGSNLEKTDFVSGRRLQLPIYALAAQEALHLGEVVEGFYWKINEGKASPFKLSTFKSDDGNGPEATYDIVLRHIERILSGIRSGEYQPRPPKGGCMSYCPAAQWCWRYQAGY